MKATATLEVDDLEIRVLGQRENVESRMGSVGRECLGFQKVMEMWVFFKIVLHMWVFYPISLYYNLELMFG